MSCGWDCVEINGFIAAVVPMVVLTSLLLLHERLTPAAMVKHSYFSVPIEVVVLRYDQQNHSINGSQHKTRSDWFKINNTVQPLFLPPGLNSICV